MTATRAVATASATRASAIARRRPLLAPHLDGSTERWYARRTLAPVNDLDAVLAAAARV